jgi:hypothetical protein
MNKILIIIAFTLCIKNSNAQIDSISLNFVSLSRVSDFIMDSCKPMFHRDYIKINNGSTLIEKKDGLKIFKTKDSLEVRRSYSYVDKEYDFYKYLDIGKYEIGTIILWNKGSNFKSYTTDGDSFYIRKKMSREIFIFKVKNNTTPHGLKKFEYSQLIPFYPHLSVYLPENSESIDELTEEIIDGLFKQTQELSFYPMRMIEHKSVILY